MWLARLHDVMVDEPFALNELGATPAHRAGHGRLNPHGTPYVYLAADEFTVIKEVRPWKGAELPLAEPSEP